MSLFPAYSEQSTSSPNPQEEQHKEAQWLQNPSFQINLTAVEAKKQQPSDAETGPASALSETCLSDDELPRKKRKAKKNKRHSDKKDKKREKEIDAEPQILKDCGFTVDTSRHKEYLTVKTISRPMVPRYDVKYRMYLGFKSKKRKKTKRYYHVMEKISKENDSEGESTQAITKKNINEVPILNREDDGNFAGFKQEEDLSNTTGMFNQKLQINPNDIKLWLEYVRFQDTVYQFEKTYRKGSIAKGLRVLAERKLAILDKALTYNPGCEALLRKRLAVAVSIYPADELQVQLKCLVDKDPGNIILWQGYIEATQCSMSHCNTKAVLALYTKCLGILHKLRRSATIDRAQLEENILKMLYQCGLFLKQAGLFEQLWTLLRMYLDLNLTHGGNADGGGLEKSNKFNISSKFQEKQLQDLEEIVFNSQLPLHELWLRTEKLRESCHWLPYDETQQQGAECEDPQRMVFTEDVVELIHPITMPENMFKLIATILTLLKIPLLPCRHTTMHQLGLDYLPWAMDSIECLLPLFVPFYPVDMVNKNMVIDSRLAVGPQYLNVLPGQEEYIDFVLTTMKTCADCSQGQDKMAITIWWLRFQRLLVILDKQNRFKMPRDLGKKIKSNVKNLLKQEENRNNVVYYCEYALIEWTLSGSSQSCINILKVADSFLSKNNQPINGNSAGDQCQTTRCHLYRTLIEVHLSDVDQHDTALKYLVGYVLEQQNPTPRDSSAVSKEMLDMVGLKFKHVTLQLLQKDVVFEKLPVVKHFLPHFAIDWIVLNGWFIYLTKGPIECSAFLTRILDELDSKHADILFQKEVLCEFHVAMLFKNIAANPGRSMFKLVDEVLFKAIETYPNNLFLLSALAKEQSIASSAGSPWWKLKSQLIKCGRAFPVLFLIMVANQQMVEMQHDVVDTVTGRQFEINDSFKNRLLSLFRAATRPDMCTRRCGLIWRLYLQFVHAHFDPQLCRDVYYCAVEECPWLKALYIDAAIYIPAELAQIQDLLIEKELRIHVTPEELDVLRT